MNIRALIILYNTCKHMNCGKSALPDGENYSCPLGRNPRTCPMTISVDLEDKDILNILEMLKIIESKISMVEQ